MNKTEKNTFIKSDARHMRNQRGTWHGKVVRVYKMPRQGDE